MECTHDAPQLLINRGCASGVECMLRARETSTGVQLLGKAAALVSLLGAQHVNAAEVPSA